MDEYYKEQQEVLHAFDKNYFNNNHFLKRTFQLVLSVSIFSLILCYSSGFSFFPHSFNVYFSTFLFSFFTHNLERKYMFLLCNGILAFLSKSKVSCSSTSSSVSASAAAGVLSASAFVASTSPVDNVVEKEVHDVVPHQDAEKGCFFEEEKGIETGVFMGETEEEEEDKESVVTQKNDIAEAEAEAVYEPSTDELNKKIEDFIRKMKEEIRDEAQQQLIVV